MIYNDFSKIQLKFVKKGKTTVTVAKQSSKPLEGGKMPRFEKLREVKYPVS